MNRKRNGMPYPTVGDARKAIHDAREKVEQGRPRQAAEDAWLGAVTAARAALRCSNGEWRSTRGVLPRFEQLVRERHRDRRLANDLYFLAGSLHGSCFYAGVPEACDAKAVEGGIRAAEAFVRDAAVLCKRRR